MYNTGNENSKPIWNKFIIRKDIIVGLYIKQILRQKTKIVFKS
jgi:hypothetical protein